MKEKKRFGFRCEHCGSWVSKDQFIGTHFRNHCPFCFYSKHVDQRNSGDRKSSCYGLMKPIGLTFKKEGFDKYGQSRQGELMMIHQCEACQEFSINRLAADDNIEMILLVFKESQDLTPDIKEALQSQKIEFLTEKDEQEIKNQLFGKKV